MSSVGWALTWEYWRKGRGWIFSAMILLCIFPGFISYGIVESSNIPSPSERKMAANGLSIAFLFLFVFLPHIIILLIEGDQVRNPAEILKRSRIFILPVSNPSLVAWRMLHGIVTVSAFSLISIFLVNLLSKKHGYVLSSISFSIFTATCFCFYYGASWYSRRNPWVGSAIMLLPFVVFYSWCRTFNASSDAFQIVTATSSFSIGKGIVMGAIIGLSFLLAIQGHKSFRCGDFPSLHEWTTEWTTGRKSLLDWFSFKPKGFSSIRSAQAWFHSRRDASRIWKLLIILMIFLIYYIPLMSVKLPEDLPGVLAIICFFAVFYILFFPISLVYEKNAFSLSSFESALPTTYRERAESILKDKIKNIITGMIIVALGYVLIFLSIGFSLNAPAILALHETFLNTGFWSTGINGYAAVLLNLILFLWILWIIIGMGTSLWLTGRCKVWMFGLFIPLICFLLGFIIWGMLKFPFIIGTIVILGVMFCFYESVKRGLLRKREILKNAAIWIGASVAISFLLYSIDKTIFPEAGVMVFGGVALALLPFALAPLALRWNQRR